jgi:hypothetical protein
VLKLQTAAHSYRYEALDALLQRYARVYALLCHRKIKWWSNIEECETESKVDDTRANSISSATTDCLAG